MATVGKGECINGKDKNGSLANKRRYILGKDLCYCKRILFALPFGPTNTTFLLCELAFPVPFAPLLASRRPDKGGGYEFFEMRCFNYHKGLNTGTI